ncbi:MAG TPA: diguanylate cyclase [Clostridia bacterium]|nr:diguanylate cyclase [Clostridia bacterium]
MVDVDLLFRIFDKAPYGAFVCDGEGYIVYANDMACSITGRKVIELTGEMLGNVIKDIPRDDNGSIQAPEATDHIHEYTDADGRSMILRIWTCTLQNGFIAVYFEDYSERRRLGKDLHDYIERFSLAESTGRTGSFELDVLTGRIWASNGAFELFGVNGKKELSGLDELLVHVGDREPLDKGLDEIGKVANQAAFNLSVAGKGKTKDRIVHLTGRKVPANGGSERMIFAVSDFTERIESESLLCEERNKFQKYIDIAGFIIIVLDETGRVRLANRKCSELLGLPREEIIGKVWIDEFIPHEIRDSMEETIRREMIEGNKPRLEHTNPILTSNGNIRFIHWNNSIIQDAKGNITGILSSGEDITEKLRMEKALADSERSLKEAELITKSGHFEKDLVSGKVKWSAGMYALFGTDSAKEGHAPAEERKYMTAESYIRYEDAFHSALRGDGTFSVEIDTTDGKVLFIKAMIERTKYRPQRVLATCQDITARREHLDRIEHISYHDHLTGLYNRRFLEEEFSRLDVKRNYPLSVIMADVNGLKLANDAFGHVEGDNILKNTAGILGDSCREDDIIARVGGDEFMILLPGTNAEDTKRIIERIEKSRFSGEETRLPVSISLGYAVKTDEGQDMDDLFKVAEDSMYRNKLDMKTRHRSKAIRIITKTLFEISPWEAEHAKRVSLLGNKIGKALNLPKSDLKELTEAGFYHDIGKVTIRENLLLKKQSLTNEDYENIRRHPETGYRILSSSNETADLADYVLSHHEWWNGGGYPQGLDGIKIPVQSRIIAIAEAYDYLTNRPGGRRPFSKRRAFAELRKGSGKQFDPEIFRLFAAEVFPEL